jgi:hypothetical protein
MMLEDVEEEGGVGEVKNMTQKFIFVLQTM